MAADALAYSVIVRELNSALKGGKITRIIQPEKDEIILTIYKDRKNFKLLLCTNSNVCRMHITEKTFSAPQTAPSFCMLLRKHLDNAVLNSVTQQPFERAADFCFTAFNDLGYPYLCHLIIELTGKSANLILTDENFKIFDSLKRAPLDSPGERRLLPGLTYSFLPSQNKIPPDDFVRLAALCAGTENPEYALNDNVMGISRDTLHEIALSIPSSPSASDIQTAFSSFMKKLQNTTPNIVVDKQGNYSDVFPVIYTSKNAGQEFYPSLNEAFDVFYNKKDLRQRYSEKARHINTVVKNALARTEKKIALQKEALLQSEKSCEMQDIGNIILSNLYRIRKGDTLLIAENYFTDNSEITILLDPLLSPQANAQSYFKKAAKLKKTADFTKTLLHENEETLNYLISVSESLRYCTDPDDLAQIYAELEENNLLRGNKSEKKAASGNKKSATVIPLIYKIDGFTVYAGKNNTQNAYVTFRLALPDDIWLHAKDIHSSHVIISNPDKKTVPDHVIQTAAEITAFYSQARMSGKTPIDTTLRRFVKRPNGARPGFVHYSEQSTIIVLPDRHAELLSDKA